MKESKRKIGIITFHCADNYGAFLQTLAMQEWLIRNTLDDEIEVIDYRPEYLLTPYRLSVRQAICRGSGLMGKIKATIIFGLEASHKIVQKYRFRAARKQLRLSACRYTNNDFQLDNCYSAVILGSDQIWNPQITNGFDKTYFGANTQADCKRIAYAASIGVSCYSEQEKRDITELLRPLIGVGVREQHTVEMLQQLCRQKVVVNLDPTLLVDRDLWHQHLLPIKEKKYILIYKLQENHAILPDAYQLAKEMDAQILHFGDPSPRPIFSDVKVKSISACGPFEFLSYIKNAELVLTNSFHGTCFSLIFEKEFYTYLQSERSERIISIAEIGGFEDRLVYLGSSIDVDKLEYIKSNVADAYKNIQALQDESANYLLDIFQSERE